MRVEVFMEQSHQTYVVERASMLVVVRNPIVALRLVSSIGYAGPSNRMANLMIVSRSCSWSCSASCGENK